jgi:hypothetical protein
LDALMAQPYGNEWTPLESGNDFEQCMPKSENDRERSSHLCSAQIEGSHCETLFVSIGFGACGLECRPLTLFFSLLVRKMALRGDIALAIPGQSCGCAASVKPW